jgi:hypothetical protein
VFEVEIGLLMAAPASQRLMDPDGLMTHSSVAYPFQEQVAALGYVEMALEAY